MLRMSQIVCVEALWQCDWGWSWHCGNEIKPTCFRMMLLGLFLTDSLGLKKRRKRLHLKCIALTCPGGSTSRLSFQVAHKATWGLWCFFIEPFSESDFWESKKKQLGHNSINEDLWGCFGSWSASFPRVSWNKNLCWEELYKRQSPTEVRKGDGKSHHEPSGVGRWRDGVERADLGVSGSMSLHTIPLGLLWKNGSFPSCENCKVLEEQKHTLEHVPSWLVKRREANQLSSQFSHISKIPGGQPRGGGSAMAWTSPMQWCLKLSLQWASNLAQQFLSFRPLFKYISMWITTIWKIFCCGKLGQAALFPCRCYLRVP